MFVVDRRATGPEILRMSTGLSELRKLPAREGKVVGLMSASVRLLRRVKALDNDMAGDEGRKIGSSSSSIDETPQLVGGVQAANRLMNRLRLREATSLVLLIPRARTMGLCVHRTD